MGLQLNEPGTKLDWIGLGSVISKGIQIRSQSNPQVNDAVVKRRIREKGKRILTINQL